MLAVAVGVAVAGPRPRRGRALRRSACSSAGPRGLGKLPAPRQKQMQQQEKAADRPLRRKPFVATAPAARFSVPAAARNLPVLVVHPLRYCKFRAQHSQHLQLSSRLRFGCSNSPPPGLAWTSSLALPWTRTRGKSRLPAARKRPMPTRFLVLLYPAATTGSSSSTPTYLSSIPRRRSGLTLLALPLRPQLRQPQPRPWGCRTGPVWLWRSGSRRRWAGRRRLRRPSGTQKRSISRSSSKPPLAIDVPALRPRRRGGTCGSDRTRQTPAMPWGAAVGSGREGEARGSSASAHAARPPTGSSSSTAARKTLWSPPSRPKMNYSK
mmetsp:Transcript_5143/g.12998  ORF Transcript_5143/g.12998 Transcript_5143/m.12998 type:complete len:323 (-) Transcript_5143:28-996(-)